jgi:hypothetical protein
MTHFLEVNMKKNILYIFICIITLILFFGIAASCNFCGIPIEVGEMDETEDTASKEETDNKDAAAVRESGNDSQGDDIDNNTDGQGQEQPQGDNGDSNEGNGDNNDPQIISIKLSEEDIFTDISYIVEADVTDADGDNLSYSWSVNGGSISDNTSNPMQWTTPRDHGDYMVNLVVNDGKGGQDTKDKSVWVGPTINFEIESLELGTVVSESGFIEDNAGEILQGGPIKVGDSGEEGNGYLVNQAIRGFISFDISQLLSLESAVKEASINFNKWEKSGEPFENFGHLYITRVSWGKDNLVSNDFNLGGYPLCSIYGEGNIICNSEDLKIQLQDAINSGEERFQVRLHFAELSDGDNISDLLIFEQSKIILHIKFE